VLHRPVEITAFIVQMRQPFASIISSNAVSGYFRKLTLS
jgi:hypothetical protein